MTSILDSGDLVLKIVEDISNNKKGIENNIDPTNFETVIVESSKIAKEEEIDFNAMEMHEWLDYIRVHRPKLYWSLVAAYGVTIIFCVWLMNKILSNGWEPSSGP